MIFLHKQDLILIHNRLIDTFGGTHGMRDEAALESAIAAVENRAYYEGVDMIIPEGITQVGFDTCELAQRTERL